MSQKILKEIDLATAKGGKITLAHIEHPYGAASENVVSIWVSLDGKEPEWKVHIPYSNIDELIATLSEIKKIGAQS